MKTNTLISTLLDKIYATEDSLDGKISLAMELSAVADLVLPSVYITTHKRSDNLPTLRTLPILQDIGTLIIAEEERTEYEAAFPDADKTFIPPGWAGFPLGAGRAKQFAYEESVRRGDELAIFMDDDLVSLSLLYTRAGGKGASHAFARAIGGNKHRLQFFEGVLTLTFLLAYDVMKTREQVLMATPQCNAANRTPASASLMWETNRGGPPAQLVVANPGKFISVTGGGFDLENFNWHGDDVGALSQILEVGGEVARLPSVLGHYWDYETRSVIRTPETAPLLRQEEHDALMERPLAQYIRTRYDLLDRPQWHAYDWAALEKGGIIEPSERKSWPEAAGHDLI